MSKTNKQQEIIEVKTHDAVTREHDTTDRTEPVSPWQLIDTGRYQPRRIRGSCRGRELG